MNKLEIQIALQDGMTAELKGDRIFITVDKTVTKRDLWDGQLEFWMNKKDEINNLSSGYLRIIKNKLSFKNWR